MKFILHGYKDISDPDTISMAKPKLEFSKGHVIFADALVAFVWLCWVLLHWFDKQPPSDLAMTMVTVYGGFATGGYFTLQGYRAGSINDKEARIYEATCTCGGNNHETNMDN